MFPLRFGLSYGIAITVRDKKGNFVPVSTFQPMSHHILPKIDLNKIGDNKIDLNKNQ